MRKGMVWLALLLVAACVKPSAPPEVIPDPPVVVEPAVRNIGVVVLNTYGDPLVGAEVTLGDVKQPTDAQGYTLFFAIPEAAGVVRIEITAKGYRSTAREEEIGAGHVHLSPFTLIAEAPTEEEVHAVKTNFCNLRDALGRVAFSPFYISLPYAERMMWLKDQARNGSTHFVLSPSIAYPGSPIGSRDLYEWPKDFAYFVREVMATPSASGKGFTPILILDGGDPGIVERINKNWQGLRDALGDEAERLLVVSGWELVNSSPTTSEELSYSLKVLGWQKWPHIWVHLGPGRASGASHPLEGDDPWQGGESIFWKIEGGENAEGFLYQSQAIRDGDEACDPAEAECWLNRWEDVVPRLGNGMNGWRIVHLVYFEGPAYYFFRGQATEAFAREAATQAMQMCRKYNVTCGWGNGRPWGV